ncbi:uncharacterized protein LOC131257879 isoform X1 [Magnolia sinica]|uniref:uncharacterized protein LOC131257879 isoform X1 n=1 Tax=Magnolia sinica TaxID=86752 RepID=UPI00265B610D|nr:uncharacterized protein LOC131257879 isoform X1 [Magnolia sinica]
MKRVSSRDSAMLSLPLRQQLTSLSAFATSHTVRVMRAEIDMVFLVHAYAAAWFLVVPSHWPFYSQPTSTMAVVHAVINPSIRSAKVSLRGLSQEQRFPGCILGQGSM